MATTDSDLIRLADRPNLQVDVKSGSGDIVSLRDLELDLTVIDSPPRWEVQVNRHPIELSMFFHEDRRGILQTIGRTTEWTAYSQGYGLQVARLAVPGRHSLHLQYRVKRVPMEHIYPMPGPNTHDLEQPLWVDTLGFLGWNFSLMRPDTKMRVCHLSGGGPFEHISAEDGPMSEVTPKLWHLMRRTYPGVQSIPGALFYRHDPEQWLFLLARRSKLAYTTDYNEHGMQFHMQYHKFMAPLEEFPVPEMSIFWGRDLEEMEALWADQFDQYEEPPEWQYHTTWTATHGAGPNPRKYSEVGDAAVASIEHGGANGIWLYTHDIKRFDTDTSPSSAGPCPNSGTRHDFRDMVKRIHHAGGRVKVWLSASGMKPWGDLQPGWSIKGVDGVPWVSWGWDAHEFITACNALDPGFRKYMLDWTRRYVEDFDVDAFFLDCGVFTLTCDFDPAHTQGHFPSEAGPAMRELFHEMWDLIQEIKPGDFHMWYEGTHSDYPGSGYAWGNMVFPPPPPEATTGQRMMYNFVRRRPERRLVWGTLSAYDLACGMAHWDPPMGGLGSVAEALENAANPMNQFIVKLVRERGTREARGITDGLSWLDNLLITIPQYHGAVTIAEPALQNLKAVEHVLTGERIEATRDEQGRPVIELPGGAAFHIVG